VQLDFALNFIDALGINPLFLLIVFPLVGAFLAAVVRGKGARVIALLVTGFELVFSIMLALALDPAAQVDEVGGVYGWGFEMGRLGVGESAPVLQILLGVDGLSIVMVILSNLVVFIAAISSNHIDKDQGSYYALFLLLETGLLGVFLSFDLISFFVFWELVLIPMFFIIGQWGEEGCEHAAVKFFIYTHLGSAAMLVGFFALFFLGGNTFNMVVLKGLNLAPMVQIGFALAVFMGAGVKLPVWPLHNWLPWAHVKAPTPGSVILAGILLKMGGYTFIRLGLWLVPSAMTRLAIPFALLAIFTCIYAAFTALAQTDMKSMVAYTSINHMAWVLLGVAVAAGAIGNPAFAGVASFAIMGAVFMMFSHGTIISVMFIMAGQLKYATGTREIPDIKGLMAGAPRMSMILILASFAAFGLPGFSGFIAEAFVLFGSVRIYIWASLISLGVFLTVGYLLWTLNRIVFSDPEEEKPVTEAPWSDLIAPVLMMIPVLLLGFWPDLILDFVQPIVNVILGVVP
jgi:NADH-quinone oxidoreductase subunit M